MSKRQSIAKILNAADIAHRHELKLYEINMLDAIYDSKEITYRKGKSEDVVLDMIKRGYILIGVNDRIRLSDEGRMIVIEYKGAF